MPACNERVSNGRVAPPVRRVETNILGAEDISTYKMSNVLHHLRSSWGLLRLMSSAEVEAPS